MVFSRFVVIPLKTVGFNYGQWLPVTGIFVKLICRAWYRREPEHQAWQIFERGSGGVKKAIGASFTYPTLAKKTGERQMAKWKAAAVAFLMSVTISTSRAATTATVRSAGEYDPNHCGFWGDSVTLVVTQDDRPSIKYNFCSAYGESKVLQVIKDKAGQTYILLEYRKGHGTRASSKYLEVYGLNAVRLNDLGDELLDEPASFAADWVYTYDVVLPPKGGLELTFKLTNVNVSDSNSPPLPAWETGVGPSPAPEKVIWIDAHPTPGR